MAQDFSTALQHDRKRLGLSQAEFAELMEVSQQTLSKWEAGTAMPRAVKLAEMLKIINDKLDGDSETIKTIGEWEIFKMVEHKAKSDPARLASLLNTPTNFDALITGNEVEPKMFSFLIDQLRIENKQRKRVQLANALRDFGSDSSFERDPYAALSKASADLEKAARAMQKATEAVEKAAQRIHELQFKKPE